MEKRRRVQDLVGFADIDLIEFFLRGDFKVGDKVLEVGCGEGRNLQLFTNSGIEYYGLDESPAAIKMAQLNLRSQDPHFNKEQVQIADITDHPFPNGAFDWVLAINVLHHCKTRKDFIEQAKSLARFLKDTGSVLIKSTTRGVHETVSFPIDDQAISLLSAHLSNHECSRVEKTSPAKDEIILVLRPFDQRPLQPEL